MREASSSQLSISAPSPWEGRALAAWPSLVVLHGKMFRRSGTEHLAQLTNRGRRSHFCFGGVPLPDLSLQVACYRANEAKVVGYVGCLVLSTVGRFEPAAQAAFSHL